MAHSGRAAAAACCTIAQHAAATRNRRRQVSAPTTAAFHLSRFCGHHSTAADSIVGTTPPTIARRTNGFWGSDGMICPCLTQCASLSALDIVRRGTLIVSILRLRLPAVVCAPLGATSWRDLPTPRTLDPLPLSRRARTTIYGTRLSSRELKYFKSPQKVWNVHHVTCTFQEHRQRQAVLLITSG
jgi:hypothetical protein